MILGFLAGGDWLAVAGLIAVFTGLVLLAFAALRYIIRQFFPAFSYGKNFLLSAISVLVLFPPVFLGLIFLGFSLEESRRPIIPATDYSVPVYQPGDSCNITFGEIHFSRALNNVVEQLTIDGAKLTLEGLPGTDYFNPPDQGEAIHSAPILLTQVDNTKPFTFTARVTPAHVATYDAGAIYLYYDDHLWHKFAFERDERGRNRIVTVRTSFMSDDNNHDMLPQPSVYLKISSDGETVGFYYSVDKVTWNLARVHRNEYPERLWLGVSSQSPTGNGNRTVFEECNLVYVSVADFRKGI